MAIINRQSSIGNTYPALALFLAASLLVPLSACSRRPAPPQPYLAFVASYQTGSVAVVHLSTFRVVASVAVMPNPDTIAIRPRTQDVWVFSRMHGRVSVLSFPGLAVKGSLQIGMMARSLTFSPDGKQAYALNVATSEIVYVDCDSLREKARLAITPRAKIEPLPALPAKDPQRPSAPETQAAKGPPPSDWALTLTPDGKTLIASDSSRGVLHFVDVGSKKLLGFVEVGKQPGPLAVLPDSSKVFVGNTGEEKLSAVDITSRRLLSHIELGMKPGALLLKPDGGELFVMCPQAATICIVDAFHDNVSQNISTGRGPAAAVSRRDSSMLYVANAGDGSVTSLDVQNRVVVASTQVGKEPRALALTPDERFLVAADAATSSLAVMFAEPERLAKMRSALVTTIPVGAGPVDVVVPDWLRE